MDVLLLAIQRMVQEGPGVQEMAQRLGMSYQVLLNQLNPHNDQHKLGLLTAVAIISAATPAERAPVLDELGRLFGGVFALDVRQETPEEIQGAALEAMGAVGDVAQSVRDATADRAISPREALEIQNRVTIAKRELDDVAASAVQAARSVA
jgi:hypothetical protein